MTKEEAIRLLDPETTADAIAEIEYYGGFFGREAAIKAIEDACVLAVETLKEKTVEHAHWESVLTPVVGATEDDYEEEAYRCDNCGRIIEEFENYCPSCGAEMYEKRECLSSV